jgi:hypothetical protein
MFKRRLTAAEVQQQAAREQRNRDRLRPWEHERQLSDEERLAHAIAHACDRAWWRGYWSGWLWGSWR